MFYLRFIGDFIISHRSLSSLLWLLSLMMIVMTFSFSNKINDYVTGLKGERVNPYFFAMIPEQENISNIRRKMTKLPGVERVKVLSTKKIEEQMTKTLQAYDSEVEAKELELNYGGLEITLAIGLQSRSQELIRQYIKRVVESPDLLIGPIEQTHSVKHNRHPLANLLSQHSTLLLLVFWIGLYMTASLKMVGELRKQCFLIETYQRKKNVFTRVFALVHTPMLVLLIIFSFQNFKLPFIFLVILAAFVALVMALNRRVVEC